MQANASTNFSTTATLAAAAASFRKSRNDKLYNSANSKAGAKELLEQAIKKNTSLMVKG